MFHRRQRDEAGETHLPVESYGWLKTLANSRVNRVGTRLAKGGLASGLEAWAITKERIHEDQKTERHSLP
jgi:hypothetical protein